MNITRENCDRMKAVHDELSRRVHAYVKMRGENMSDFWYDGESVNVSTWEKCCGAVTDGFFIVPLDVLLSKDRAVWQRRIEGERELRRLKEEEEKEQIEDEQRLDSAQWKAAVGRMQSPHW